MGTRVQVFSVRYVRVVVWSGRASRARMRSKGKGGSGRGSSERSSRGRGNSGG